MGSKELTIIGGFIGVYLFLFFNYKIMKVIMENGK